MSSSTGKSSMSARVLAAGAFTSYTVKCERRVVAAAD